MFPVRRIWCVGRNYLEHIKEMGQDEREPPFFFAKPADAIVHDGGTVPYPPLTKDLHHEVELVVALKAAAATSRRQGARLRLGLRRRHRPDAPRPADRLAQHQAAVGNRQGVRRLGAVRPAQAGFRDRPSEQGPITLKVNGKVKQDGDLEQMIWNVPEIIWKLSEMVALAAGDIIMTGTPAGVSAVQPATSSNARSRASAR
jgi:fumarylpyruvate hydrolase